MDIFTSQHTKHSREETQWPSPCALARPASVYNQAPLQGISVLSWEEAPQQVLISGVDILNFNYPR